MRAFQTVCNRYLALASALILLGGAIALSRAEGPDPPAAARATLTTDTLPPSPEPAEQPEQLPVAKQRALARAKGSEDASAPGKESDGQAPKAPGSEKEPGKPAAPAASAAPSGQKFDPAVVSAGMVAFERSCTSCHDAARALERTKDLAGWRATVRRMAAKRSADIPSSDIEPIAVYLASRSAAPSGAGADKDKTGEAAAAPAAAATTDTTPSTSFFATLSPQWRGGNDHLQNPGFGPLAWAGASWQGQVVSARLTACIACHGVKEVAFLSRVEVVEAAARVDLSQFLDPCWHGMKGGIDAGRIVIPFGAFAAQTNPGVYRTVSTPLIFNMGQRVFNQDLGVPVLPMPYANTAVDLNLDAPLGTLATGPISASLDAYLNNGLQGSSDGIDWLQSRNLLDNNDRPGYGGRITLGDPYLRAGASIMSGRFDDPTDLGVTNGPLRYTIWGVDLQARYKRLFRCQIEYARRDSKRDGVVDNETRRLSETVDGYYLEAEVRPWEKCCVSFLARQDFLRTRSPLPPPGSTLPTGTFNVERATFGVNIELWHQSLLMINYERWLIPENPSEANVFGVRYTVTF
jgi:hypothetical protein